MPRRPGGRREDRGGASVDSGHDMRRRVTFSRNYTLSLSRTCQCFCKYCSFSTHQAHLYSPDEVDGFLDEALKRRAKELLILTGEKPEVDPVVRERLTGYGHEDFTSYVVWACERALERGLLPHTNLGVLDARDLSRLREVSASQGLMLESVSERLMTTVHAGSPTKHPARRLRRSAGGRAEDPVHVRASSSAWARPRTSASPPWRRSRRCTREYGHLQEIILQNFVPHERYYGREPAQIADASARRYWSHRDRRAAGPAAAGLGVRGHDRGHEAADRRDAPPDARRRDPGPAEPRRVVARARRRRARPTSAA